MQERALSNDRIAFRWNSQVVDLIGDTKLVGAVIRDTVSGESSTMDLDGLFVAIGHTPNTALFNGQLTTDANGYLHTGPGTYTNVPGVFACGDVQDHTYRQAITAAASGCMAAIDAERWLEAQHDQRTHP
jgi:thioredoxin reductase (NADPH)